MRIDTLTWRQLLQHCETYDVENGDSPEHIYSVLKNKNSITVWDRTGWNEGYFLFKIVGSPHKPDDTSTYADTIDPSADTINLNIQKGTGGYDSHVISDTEIHKRVSDLIRTQKLRSSLF